MNTPMTQGPGEIAAQEVAAKTVKRKGRPEKIANVVIFLLGDEAKLCYWG